MRDLDINSSIDINKKSNKKTLMIVGIVIAVIVIVLLIVFTILYFCTDIFKSEKQLFMKYVSQAANKEEGFVSNNLVNYFEKKSSTPYGNEGTLSANITVSDEEMQKQFEPTNNFNISFSGQVDTANKKAAEEIKLNYTEEVNMPIQYKRNDKVFGLQMDDVSEKFIAMDFNNMSTLLGGNTELQETINTIIDEIDNAASTIDITDSEAKHIQDTYIKLIDDELSDDSFTKIMGDVEGYRLMLTDEQIKNLGIKILETAQNDQVILDILNKGNTSGENTITSENIGKIKDSMNDITTNGESFEITVYGKKGKATQISISIASKVNIEIKKQESVDSIQYDMNLKGQQDSGESSISFNATFTGIQSQNVTESYKVGIGVTAGEEGEMYYTYNIDNNVNFIDSVEIEDFTEENTTMLTDYNGEQVLTFIGAVGERLTETTQNLLQQAQIEESQDPLTYMIPGMAGLVGNNAVLTKSQLTEEDNVRGEAVDRINLALNGIYTDLLAYQTQGTQITEDDIMKSLQGNGLTQQYSTGVYSAPVINVNPEEGDKIIELVWTPKDGGETISGSISYQPNGDETSYKIEPATAN